MNNLIAKGKERNIDIEIFKTRNKCTDINSMNDTIKLFQISDITRYKIKAIKNGKCIEIVTESLKNTNELLDALEDIFSLQENENKNSFCKNNLVEKADNREEIDIEKIKNDLLSLNDLKKKYSCIKSIEADYTHTERGNYITNLINNCDMEDETYFNAYGVAITVNKDDITRVLYIGYYTKKYDFSEFKEYLLKKLEYLLIKLDSKSVTTNKYKVLLTNNVVESILFTFKDSFQSKNIFLNESVLSGKLNSKIFSDKINIVEDSPKGILNANFDSEGTLKAQQALVENGIFKKEINNIEYAIKLNKEATGNANGVNNLYIECGNKSYEELIKELDNGIIIDEAFGFHSGVDLKTGNISVQAEGLLVENGKITKGLNMIILSTNLFEVFSNVLEVGSDLSNFSLSVRTPSLLLYDITITGKE